MSAVGEQYPAIADLLKHSENFPHEGHMGTVAGFGMNRDKLIALLRECTPALSSISVIPHHIGDGDMTSFEITIYVSFARSEVGMTVAPNQANRGSEES